MYCSAALFLVLLSAAGGFPTGTPPPNNSTGGTCASAGHTNGCCQLGFNQCTVDLPGHHGEKCYCDEGCHAADECCSDIKDIKCYASTCKALGMTPGCCIRSYDSPCFTGSCFCDFYCHFHKDCCSDVQWPPSCYYSSADVQTRLLLSLSSKMNMDAKTAARKILESRLRNILLFKTRMNHADEIESQYHQKKRPFNRFSNN